jgi:L-rhamnose isomerase/sugar isomerase
MHRTAATALVTHQIELPSWAFRGGDVRINGWTAAGAPGNAYELRADAAVVHRFTGLTPSVALHLPADHSDDYPDLARHAAELGLSIGSVHPEVNLRQGRPPGLCHAEEWLRRRAIDQLLAAVEVAAAVHARRLTLRFVDDSPYPGQAELQARRDRLAAGLAEVYARLPAGLRLVIEYSVLEPCFYTMDTPDWGTAYAQCQALGPAAQVLVDTGPYAQGRHPDFVPELLRRDGRLGGVVLLSPPADEADPFDLFLVLTELAAAGGGPLPLALDPGANRKPGILPLIRSALGVQEAAARAAQLDGDAYRIAHAEGDQARAHELLIAAYSADVTETLAEARALLGVDLDPVAAYHEACHTEHRAAERRAAEQRMAARRASTQYRATDRRPVPRRTADHLHSLPTP